MKIRKADTKDYPRIMEIWESSVKATHDFLKKPTVWENRIRYFI